MSVLNCAAQLRRRLTSLPVWQSADRSGALIHLGTSDVSSLAEILKENTHRKTYSNFLIHMYFDLAFLYLYSQITKAFIVFFYNHIF